MVHSSSLIGARIQQNYSVSFLTSAKRRCTWLQRHRAFFLLKPGWYPWLSLTHDCTAVVDPRRAHSIAEWISFTCGRRGGMIRTRTPLGTHLEASSSGSGRTRGRWWDARWSRDNVLSAPVGGVRAREWRHSQRPPSTALLPTQKEGRGTCTCRPALYANIFD